MKLCGILGVIDILIPAANEQYQGVEHSFPTSWLHDEKYFSVWHRQYHRFDLRKKIVGAGGLEPPTNGLRVRYSTN